MSANSNHNFLEFKKLFDDNYQQFTIQATRIVKSSEIAEDIVQDCFMKYWEKQSELEITGSTAGYVSRMVKNKCLDHLRSSSHLRIVEDANKLDNIVSDSYDKLEYNELIKSVNDIIDALPERCRQVFILSRFEKMSYKEISDELSISPKTVENQISKALKVLRIRVGKFLSILF